MSKINIIVNDKKITAKEIKTLLSKVEAKEGKDIFYSKIRNHKKEQKAIRHSTFITARKESYGRYNGGIYFLNSLIGIVRIIGDSTYEYYISEVMVLPEYQNKGIGTKLMKASLDYCKENGFMKIFLTSAPGREKYYRRFGFKTTKYKVMRILNKKLRRKNE